MQTPALDEPTAFRKLQKAAAARNAKLAEPARRILAGDLVLNNDPPSPEKPPR
jgi:AmiR/NasT family two-component response regulator